MASIEQVNKIIEAFVDSEANKVYVHLPVSKANYTKLKSALDVSYKFMLVTGPAGSGKSFLINRLYEEYRTSYNLFLYKTPTFDEKALLNIYKKVTGTEEELDWDTNDLLVGIRENIEEDITIILDEAQNYSHEKIEWIRILSNEERIKFIITMHSLDKELEQQQHFKTRIYDIVEMENLDLQNVEFFIKQKLLKSAGKEFVETFKKRDFRLVFRCTHGNLRDINRLMHRYFMITKDLVEAGNYNPKATNKYLEIAALDLKMLASKSFLDWILQWF